MVLIVCPICSTAAEFVEIRMTAEEFCRMCDFPLFWAPEAAVGTIDDVPTSSGRRLPGVAGRESAGKGLSCPVCGEPNSFVSDVCIRCASELLRPSVDASPELASAQTLQEPVGTVPTHAVEASARSDWNRPTIGFALLSGVLALTLVLVLLI